jgi:hypothetical protein
MLVNFELLGQLGLQDAAMEDAWNGTYKFDQMGSYKQDVAKVVAALLGMKVPTLGDVVLTDVLQFSPGDLGHVQDIALDILDGISMPVNENFRKLYAAATLAYFEDSEKYLARDKEKPIIAKMVEAIPEGVRSAEGVQTDLQQLEQTYRQAGPGLKSLFDR